MDKQNNGKTITIKINGEKRPFFEDNPKEETPSTENRNDQMENQSPQEKHEVIVETAATQEAEESFDWILPQQPIGDNELSLYKSAKVPKQQRKGIRLPALSKVEKKNFNSSAIKSIALSVIFAVLLGTGFGFVMLKLVITDSSKDKTMATKALIAANKEATNMNSKSQQFTTLNPYTAYMVQGGVYSKKETANHLATQAKKDGIPAEIIEINQQYYIFFGVAGSLEDAKSLGKVFKDRGIDEVFAKTITIPEKKLSNLSSEEKLVIENATMLIPLLADLSSNPIIGKSLSKNELKSLSELKAKLSTIDSKGIKNEKIQELNTEVSGALKQISNYQKKKDKDILEGVQQHLLTILAEYYSI